MKVASSTDDKCRLAEEFCPAQVSHPKNQLEVTEQAEANSRFTRKKPRKVKVAVNREALERLRAT